VIKAILPAALLLLWCISVFAAKAKKGKRHKRLASKMACNWHLTGDVWGKTRTIVGPTKCKKSREQRLRSLQKERGL